MGQAVCVQLQTQKGVCFAHVGSGILPEVGMLLAARKSCVFVDTTLVGSVEPLVQSLRDVGQQVSVFPVEVSESLKSLTGVAPLYDHLVRQQADRDTVLFAVGGGVVGDVVGFVAATFKRGVRWVGVPTTLLSQVDSCVGGKTALNHASAKNTLGLIYHPAMVVCDVTWLDQLPLREKISGMGEVVKHAMLSGDPLLRAWAQQGPAGLQNVTSEAWIALVEHNLRYKTSVVILDEWDSNGVRERLNAGHTIGHALEVIAGYGSFRHGEAVLWGLAGELQLALNLGVMHPDVFQDMWKLIAPWLAACPPLPWQFDEQRWLDALRQDKKNKAGALRCSLLANWGEARTRVECDTTQVLRAVQFLHHVREN